MPKERIHFPETLPGAAKFSADVALNDPVELVTAFLRVPSIAEPLIARAAALRSPYGRRGYTGSWVLVAIAYIASRQTDIQPFWTRATLDVWQACGFDQRPCYSTTHARLTELEEIVPEIQAAIGQLVHHYRGIEPRIGRHIHIDGTEAETHSSFEHGCSDNEYCALRRDGETAADVNKRMRGKADLQAVQKRRHQEDAGEITDTAEEQTLERSPATASDGIEGGRQKHRVRTSNHTWLTHDPDAGFRTYFRPNGTYEGWHGYYHIRAVDDFTGLTIYAHAESSSRTEASQYETMLRGILETINGPDACGILRDVPLVDALTGSKLDLPEAVVGDRGFGYPFIHEINTRLGIATVTPWRNLLDGRSDPAEITLTGRDGIPVIVDRHGVIHCKHCGGPTKVIDFRNTPKETPRLYVKCQLPAAPNSPCHKTQSVACDHDWRMLTPLPRNDRRYVALESRFQFERAHHHARVRNKTGGKDVLTRPKRLGRAWQQLRLDLGNLTDWLRAGIKNGWLNSDKFTGYPKKVTDGLRKARQRLEEQVDKRLDTIRAERAAAGLDLCLTASEPEEPPPR